MAKSALQSCGNCGRRVQPHQTKLDIPAKGGMMFFHETWEGCYESTRESAVVMTKTEHDLQLLGVLNNPTGYDYN
jgi:hypothetical protein